MVLLTRAFALTYVGNLMDNVKWFLSMCQSGFWGKQVRVSLLSSRHGLLQKQEGNNSTIVFHYIPRVVCLRVVYMFPAEALSPMCFWCFEGFCYSWVFLLLVFILFLYFCCCFLCFVMFCFVLLVPAHILNSNHLGKC